MILSEIPSIITDSSTSLRSLHSLKKADVLLLEKCSQMDMVICQYLTKLVELWGGDIPNLLPTNKRKSRFISDEMNELIPSVFSHL